MGFNAGGVVCEAGVVWILIQSRRLWRIEGVPSGISVLVGSTIICQRE